MKKWKLVFLCAAVLTAAAGCGKNSDTTTGTTAAVTEAGTEKVTTENSESGTGAGTEEKTEPKTEKATAMQVEVVSEGMVPVTPDQLKDGTYEITVKSSSSMFSIESCTLTVQEGKMTAKMTMGGTGYLYIFPGTGEEAEGKTETEYIPFVEEGGKHTFTFPVTALNQAVPCAAFSKKKESWYDRELCFEATALSMEAYKELPYKTVEDLSLKDGTYTVEVTLSGGSGRASVESPAELKIEQGMATAKIIWSSSKYDFCMINGEKYEPVSAEGENSAFLIPVAGFDYPLPIQADTTAMSEAHLIDYTLQFDSNSIK